MVKNICKLFYTKIDIIDANEGAKVVSKSYLSNMNWNLKTQEGGEISVNQTQNFIN